MKKSKKIQQVNKNSDSLRGLIEEAILCLESHFNEEGGRTQAEEGLSLFLEVIAKALESKNFDAEQKEELLLAKQSVIDAQKRMEEGTFGKNIEFKNFSATLKNENIFKEFLEKCA